MNPLLPPGPEQFLDANRFLYKWAYKDLLLIEHSKQLAITRFDYDILLCEKTLGCRHRLYAVIF